MLNSLLIIKIFLDYFSNQNNKMVFRCYKTPGRGVFGGNC